MRSTPSSRRAQAGFTLIELLVSLAVTAVLILGVLATFDFSTRMNRVQLNLADMQQSLRIAQNEVVKYSRMTGRGSLPANMAVQAVNNVPANTKLVTTESKTEILEGTDVLRLRGVFSSSLYQIDWQDADAVWSAPIGGNGSVLVRPLAAGVPQNLTALLTTLNEYKDNESLLLVTPFDVYAVATLDGEARMEGPNLRIDFKRHLNEAALGGPLIDGMNSAAYIGILEEYVFYVRKGDAADSPVLAKARMEPGSNQAYKNDKDNVLQDLADNIYDMQVAIGFGVAGAPEMRLTTLARTDRSDPGQYQAPLLPVTIEDHAYPSNHALNTAAQRRHRWRLMRTNVNLRNL